MDTETVTPAETTDQPKPPERAKRAAFVADLHGFADWLTANPWVPLPYDAAAWGALNLPGDPASVAPSLARLQEIAARTGDKIDESLPDRTVLTVTHGRVGYRMLVWHPDGRPGERGEREAELERLRAEVAELRAAAASTKPVVCLGVPAGIEGSCGQPGPHGPTDHPMGAPLTDAEYGTQISTDECGCPVFRFTQGVGDSVDTIVRHVDDCAAQEALL